MKVKMATKIETVSYVSVRNEDIVFSSRRETFGWWFLNFHLAAKNSKAFILINNLRFISLHYNFRLIVLCISMLKKKLMRSWRHGQCLCETRRYKPGWRYFSMPPSLDGGKEKCLHPLDGGRHGTEAYSCVSIRARRHEELSLCRSISVHGTEAHAHVSVLTQRHEETSPCRRALVHGMETTE